MDIAFYNSIMSHDCRKIMPTRFNLVDELRDTTHPDNARACVCQEALESDIAGGTLPDRVGATEEDRQKAVDRACRESFYANTSHRLADSPEQYVTRARNRYQQDLDHVVEARQQRELSNQAINDWFVSAYRYLEPAIRLIPNFSFSLD